MCDFFGCVDIAAIMKDCGVGLIENAKKRVCHHLIIDVSR